MFKALLAALACVLLTACVSTSTTEPQGRSLRGGSARIYVIRPDILRGKFVRYDVSIDGQLVGKVASGSYISFDRPPGRHQIRVTPLIDISSATHDFSVEAGRSYYFVVNTKGGTSAVVSGSFVMPIPIFGTSIGRPTNQGNFMSGIYLGELDSAQGRAILARMRP